MASGRLVTKLHPARDTSNVYAVPAGVEKVAYSLIAENVSSELFNMAILYTNNSITDTVIDYNNSTKTTVDYNIIFTAEANHNGIADLTIPSGYNRDQLRAFPANTTVDFYLTSDQKYFWASANNEWRQADVGYHYNLVVNSSTGVETSYDFVVYMVPDNNSVSSGSIIYTLNQTSGLKLGQITLSSTAGNGDNFGSGPHGNYRLCLASTSRFGYINGISQYYIETTTSNLDGTTNSSFSWTQSETNPGLTADDPAWFISDADAYGLDVSTGLYRRTNGMASLVDTSWNWESTGVTLSEGTGVYSDFAFYSTTNGIVWKIDSPTAFATDVEETTLGFTGGTNTYIAPLPSDTNKFLVVSDAETWHTGNNSLGFTEISSDITYTDNISSFTSVQGVFSSGPIKVANNAESITVDYTINSTYDGRLLQIVQANTSSINLVTFNDESYFVLNDISNEKGSFTYTTNTDVVTIPNAIVGENIFNMSSVEVSGRIIGTGDAVKVYATSDINLTILGIEE